MLEKQGISLLLSASVNYHKRPDLMNLQESFDRAFKKTLLFEPHI